MKLWSITITSLTDSVNHEETWCNVICKATTRKQLMSHLYANKFTRTWWDEHLVTSIVGPKEIWYNEGS